MVLCSTEYRRTVCTRVPMFTCERLNFENSEKKWMIGRSHHQPHFVVYTYICTIGNNACVSATQLHVKEKISFI